MEIGNVSNVVKKKFITRKNTALNFIPEWRTQESLLCLIKKKEKLIVTSILQNLL